MNTLLDKFFPIPDFLRMPAVGIDISDTMITYTEIVHTNKGMGVGRFGQKALDEGIISKGVVQDTQKLQTILSALHEELGIHFARVTAPEQLVFGFVITIPKVDHKEIPAAIEFQIEEHIPAAKTELIFDYEILTETSRNYRLKVSAVTERVFESYRAVLEDSGFHLVHFEPKPEANLRGLVRDDAQQDAVIVDIGKDHSSISIVENDLIISSASVDFNSGGAGNIDTLGDEITRYYNYWRTKDVKRVVSVEDTKETDDRQESEEQKESQSDSEEVVPDKEASEGETKTKDEKAADVDQEKESSDTTRSMYPIVVCGDVEGSVPSFEQLAKKLDTEVVQGAVWNAPDVEGDAKYHIPKNDVAKYTTAIGLALSDF